jgi:hypothetical protein
MQIIKCDSAVFFIHLSHLRLFGPKIFLSWKLSWPWALCPVDNPPLARSVAFSLRFQNGNSDMISSIDFQLLYSNRQNVAVEIIPTAFACETADCKTTYFLLQKQDSGI